MVKKIFLLTILLLFSSFAMAADPQVLDFNYTTPVVYGKTTQFTVQLDTNETSGTVNMWDGETIIEQKNYLIDTNIITFDKIFTQIGTKTIKFSITNPNQTDINTQNNLIQKDIEIIKGTDFLAKTLILTPETYLPNTNIKTELVIENIGDQNYLGGVDIVFFYDGNELGYTTITNINMGETKIAEYTITLPPDFQGQKLIMAQINRSGAVKEFDLTNNTISRTISETSLPNLLINSFTYDGTPTKAKGTKFKLLIKNEGGTLAENVAIKIYDGAIGDASKIYDTIITSLNSHSTQEIDFTFFFTDTKSRTFIAYIDPLNNIQESNDNDNTYTINFDVNDNGEEIDIGEYLTNLSIVEGQLTDCENKLYPVQLEKENALTSLSAMTKERDNCVSNLNVCNSNNATALANWVKGAETQIQIKQDDADTQFVALQNTYFSQLNEKDTAYTALQEKYNKDITAEKSNTDFAVAAFFILVLFIVGNKFLQGRNKQISRLVK